MAKPVVYIDWQPRAGDVASPRWRPMPVVWLDGVRVGGTTHVQINDEVNGWPTVTITILPSRIVAGPPPTEEDAA